MSTCIILKPWILDNGHNMHYPEELRTICMDSIMEGRFVVLKCEDRSVTIILIMLYGGGKASATWYWRGTRRTFEQTIPKSYCAGACSDSFRVYTRGMASPTSQANFCSMPVLFSVTLSRRGHPHRHRETSPRFWSMIIRVTRCTATSVQRCSRR